MFKKFILFIIGFFFFQQANAQLVGKERIDSIREATRARIDSMRLSNKLKSDSIKEAVQRRKDSLIELREAKKSNLENSENIKTKNTPTISKKDSISASKKELLEKRKQETLAKRNSLGLRKEKPKPISQQLDLGIRIASDGWSLFSSRGFIKSEDPEKQHTFIIWADISEKKNPRETTSLNENFSNLNPGEPKPISYKYGKVNNFYQFKFGVGNMKQLSGKLDSKSIEIFWTYGAGISIGLLKPYYLDLLIPEGNSYIRRVEKYDDSIKSSFLDLNNKGTIVGGTDFTNGLNELKIQPGVAMRSGFYFDYAARKKSFVGIEIGVSAEFYTQEIPIMINTKNSAYFFNIYLDARFGRRWAQQ